MTKRELARDLDELREQIENGTIEKDTICYKLRIFSSILRMPDKEYGKESDLEEIVEDYLRLLKVPKNLKGYVYLKEIILNSLRTPTGVRKSLYKEIENKYETDYSNVERSIRTVKEKTFEVGNNEMLQVLFRKKEIPINSEFVAVLAEDIKTSIKKY